MVIAYIFQLSNFMVDTGILFNYCNMRSHSRECWMTFWPLTNSDFPTDQTFHQFNHLYTEYDLRRIMSGFHGVFATGLACYQGTLTLPDTWFRPPFLGTCLCSNCWDQILRTCHIFTRLFTLNTPLYFLDFAFDVIKFAFDNSIHIIHQKKYPKSTRKSQSMVLSLVSKFWSNSVSVKKQECRRKKYWKILMTVRFVSAQLQVTQLFDKIVRFQPKFWLKYTKHGWKNVLRNIKQYFDQN